jgi:hypothetical protein
VLDFGGDGHHRRHPPGRGPGPSRSLDPAVEPGGEIRDGARVAEFVGDALISWLKGARLTCFCHQHHRQLDRPTGTAAPPDLRRRRCARSEDRTRATRDTGLHNLPLHDAAQNRSWLEIVQLAFDLLA